MTEFAIYAGAAVAYGALAVVCVLWVIGRTRTFLRWYRKTRFGQATKPIHGVMDIPRLLQIVEFRNDQEHREYRYKPMFACIGTAKFSVGVLFMEGRKKRPQLRAKDLTPKARSEETS